MICLLLWHHHPCPPLLLQHLLTMTVHQKQEYRYSSRLSSCVRVSTDLIHPRQGLCCASGSFIPVTCPPYTAAFDTLAHPFPRLAIPFVPADYLWYLRILDLPSTTSECPEWARTPIFLIFLSTRCPVISPARLPTLSHPRLSCSIG